MSGPIINGFHFTKAQPVESHVFAQQGTSIYKSDNAAAVPNADTFTAFQTVASGETAYFTQSADGCMAFCDGTTNYVWGGSEYRVSYFAISPTASGLPGPADWTFYDYTQRVNNTLDDAQNVAVMHSVSGACTCYVGSTRPLRGIKFYVKTANTNLTSAVAVNYWSSSGTWTAVSGLVDGTAGIGFLKSLSQTGWITFTDTTSVAQVKNGNNQVCYQYQLIFSGLDATTSVYHCTCDAAPQAIKDIWDGIERQCMQAFYSTTYFRDDTINVSKVDYEPSTTYTFSDISNMPVAASAEYWLGFAERMQALVIVMGQDAINTNSATAVVSYWNGSAWVAVNGLENGTLDATGAKTFNRSGTISWIPPAQNLEFTLTQNNEQQWYYYRVTVSATLSAKVNIDFVAGIPAQRTVPPYRFPVFWQNRIWLLNDQSQKKHAAQASGMNSVCVFNGSDAPLLEFGTDGELTAGAALYTRYGGTIYENLIVTKKNETWLVDGIDPTSYKLYRISNTVGCPAPLTMKSCDLGYEVAPGLLKHVLIWQTSTDITMFDGNSFIPISLDIKNFFDSTDANYINESIIDQFSAFYDQENKEYHWLFATGSSTYLNQEWVYDLIHKKWYQVNRMSAANALQCGFILEDTYGNRYNYGGTYGGYLERLEYGTTMDGQAIQYKFRTGDLPLAKTAMYEAEVRYIRLTAKGKNTVPLTNVTVNHYLDTNTTAYTPRNSAGIPVISQAKTGARVYTVTRDFAARGIFHSTECVVSTTTENIGFEPILLSGLYRIIREARL